jgi:aspartate racemase
MNPSLRDVWGIIGGVGPLASTQFLASIYEQSSGRTEQDLPIVLLFSDPTIPDRTNALLCGRQSQLADEVVRRANWLLAAGATKLVLCCVSLHPVVPLLPASIRDKLISLVDVIVDAVEHSITRHLLLCTHGVRQSGLFEGHTGWRRIAAQVVLPDDEDQRAIHDLIYRIKWGDSSEQHMVLVEELMRRYGVESCVAACTEIHVLSKEYERQRRANPGFRCIDPLAILASTIGNRNPVSVD